MRTVKIRDLVLGEGEPKICVPVIAHTYDELVRTLDTVRKSSFDLMEFRADFYFEEEAPALAAVRSAAGRKPVIYTIRTKEEGGEIEISDDVYRERNLQAAGMADMMDIQFERLHTGKGAQLHSDLVDRLHSVGMKVILSWHDFDRTPKRHCLVEKMLAMQKEGCDVTKIAVMANSRMDVCELITASVEMLEGGADRPFITMSMGNTGRLTRMACAFTGSCVTFGTAGAASAPGQIPADTLRKILDELNI